MIMSELFLVTSLYSEWCRRDRRCKGSLCYFVVAVVVAGVIIGVIVFSVVFVLDDGGRFYDGFDVFVVALVWFVLVDLEFDLTIDFDEYLVNMFVHVLDRVIVID